MIRPDGDELRAAGAGPSVLAQRTAHVCLLVIAFTHYAEIGHKIDEAPYVAVLFGGLIVASLTVAVLLPLPRWEGIAWPAAFVLGISALGAYVLSRSVPLPQLEDHVGHWLDPEGVGAVVAEAILCAVAVHVIMEVDAARVLGPVTVVLAFAITTAVALGATGETDGHSHAGGVAPAAHQHGVVESAQPTHAHPRPGDSNAHRGRIARLAGATKAERGQARRLWEETRVVASLQFASYDLARAAGFEPLPQARWTRPVIFHLRSRAYDTDDVWLDADRPESLVYYWPREGDPVLVGIMYRYPNGLRPPFAGPIPSWHSHVNQRSGLMGPTQMTHVWLTEDLRSAWAGCLPVGQLERATPGFSYEPVSAASGHETTPCGAV